MNKFIIILALLSVALSSRLAIAGDPTSIDLSGTCPAVSKTPSNLNLLLTTLASAQCDFIKKSGIDSGLSGKLSDFWAQEYVGADLAKELVSMSKKVTPVSIALIDGLFNWATMRLTPELDPIMKRNPTDLTELIGNPYAFHGSSVASLINSPGDQAAAGEWATIKDISVFGEAKASDPSLKMADGLLFSGKPVPRILNTTMIGAWSVPVTQAMKRLSDQGLIIVASAGNNFGSSGEVLSPERSLSDQVIFAGSLSPLGFPSVMSSDGPEVLIGVPSDNFEMAKGQDPNKYNIFGYTSGASPPLTGAIANVLAIAPELDNNEIRELIKRTAIPSPNSRETPQRNGAGMLNSYKMVFVANEIQQQCKDSSNLKQCFEQKIEDPRSYIFESKELASDSFQEKLQRSFPRCTNHGNQGNKKTESCAEKADVLKLIRAQALLSPEKKEAWALLSCIYNNEGYSVNAKFYSLLAKQKQTLKEQDLNGVLSLIHGLSNTNLQGSQFLESSLVRASPIFGKPGFAYLKQRFDTLLKESSSSDLPSEDLDTRSAIVITLGSFGDAAVPLIQQAIEKQISGDRGTIAAARLDKKNSQVLMAEAQKIDLSSYLETSTDIGYGSEHDQWSLVQQALQKNPNDNVVIRMLYRFGAKSLPYLRAAISSDDVHARMAAVEAAGFIGSPGGEIFEAGLKDKDKAVREESARQQIMLAEEQAFLQKFNALK